MKKIFEASGWIILFLFLFGSVRAQSIDTVIHTDIYTSYFNYQLHEPLFVSYQLFKGGGDCSRAGMTFKTGGLIHSATEKDYAHNGYDEGHLVDAADFSFDCKKEEETFRFYNCVPQTPRLNRGIWKTYETSIRKLSQTDSLYIIAGSIFGTKTIGLNKIAVPDYCWKVVYSLSTKKVIECLIFPNDNSDSVRSIDLQELKRKIGYSIVL